MERIVPPTSVNPSQYVFQMQPLYFARGKGLFCASHSFVWFLRECVSRRRYFDVGGTPDDCHNPRPHLSVPLQLDLHGRSGIHDQSG